MAGNKVLKSTKLGDDLYPISDDLSRKQMDKINVSMKTTGGITTDATGAETYGTVVALAESYVKPGWLFAGTDDGNVWLTRNDGANWEQIPTSRFAGLPNEVYVTRIEPSHFDTLTFYIAFDNHRNNDFTPYLYVTNDAGRSFRSLAAGLPKGSPADYLHVVREDPTTRDLLYVGSSIGAYVSLDRGASWTRFMTGMPSVPVFDLKIHPRDRELIAATHGRGFWIVDVAPLQQMAGGAKIADVHLFEPKTAFEYGQGAAMGASSNGEGHKVFNAPSPAYGADIVYRVTPNAVPQQQVAQAQPQNGQAPASQQGAAPQGGRRAPVQARIVITDAKGDTVRTLTGPATAGLHRVTWDLRGRAKPEALSPSAKRDSVLQANRISFVFDSLATAGTLPKPMADRLKTMMASGDFGGLFGGGRGGAGAGARFVERPGEGVFRPGGRGGAGGGESAQAGGEQNPMEALQAFPGGFQALQDLLRPPGARGVFGAGPFGGGRGGQAPTVKTGDYLVTVFIGGQKLQQLLRVERVSGGDDSGFSFEEDDARDP